MTNTMIPSTSVKKQSTRRRRWSTGSIILDVVLFVFAVIMVAPLFWLVSQSLTPSTNAFTIPPAWIPIPATLENYTQIGESIPLGRMFLNSIVLAVICTGGSLFFSVLAAYGFSRLPFKGSRLLLVTLLGALMVPAQLVVIPVFVLMRNLGLIDNLASLWLPALINVFQIFFLTQYFGSIPRELDEAAIMDGAGHGWILFRMLVPLSIPAITALAILSFEASWNNYFGPLIFLSSPENMTLPLGLVTLQSGFGSAPAVVVFAAITLVVLPMLILFLAFQKNFVSSIAATGIKG